MNSVPTEPSATPTDLLTRAVAGFLVLILIDAAQLLAFYPDRTDTLWAWTIQPPLSAMLLGSVYAAGAYFFARILFGAPWERVAAGLPPIIAFVWMAAIATLIHLDRFHEDSLPFAAWAALYIVTPIAVPLLYLHNRQPIGGSPLPGAMRIGLGIVGGAIVSASLVIYAVPDVAIDAWPYPLTPLTARISAAVFVVYGGVWLSVALYNSTRAARIPLEALTIGLVVLVAAFARGEEAILLAGAAAVDGGDQRPARMEGHVGSAPVHDLTLEEVRVLGCLLEKQRTTPDTYPLTLNALRAACNQSTNREPVVAYDEETVRDALDRLGRRRFTRLTSYHGSRAAKFRHLLDEALQIGPEEQAVLAVMMLRGPQTPGELLQRTERLHRFPDSTALQAVVDGLQRRELVARYERRPGQREDRFGHLLGDEAEEPAAGPPPPAAAPVAPREDRLDRLERELAELRAEVAALREELGA